MGYLSGLSVITTALSSGRGRRGQRKRGGEGDGAREREVERETGPEKETCHANNRSRA